VVLRGGYFNLNKNNTLQLQDFADINKYMAETGIITSHYLNFSMINFNTQLRLFNTENFYTNNTRNNDTQLYIDELYASSPLSNTTLGIGRKKVATQFSYFYPVLDIMATTSINELNYFDRKIERSGQDLIDFEVNTNYGNFYIAYVPEFQTNSRNFLESSSSPQISKLFVKVSQSFLTTNTDVVVIYANTAEEDNHYNTGGLGINQSIGDNTIIYTEVKFSDSNNFKNQYTSQIGYQWDYNLGINYTFNNGINFLAEYYGNNYGFTQSQYKSMLQNPIPPEYLYNNYTEIKRDYLSLRLAELSLPIKTELGGTINLNDKGVILFSTLEKEITDNLKIYSDINYFFQNKYSETNNIYYNFSILFSLKYFV
jgi:hypothetical protein